MKRKTYNKWLAVLSPEKRLQKNMIAIFKYLNGCHAENGKELFRVFQKT